MKRVIMLLCAASLSLPAIAEEEEKAGKKVMISPDMYSLDVMHNGQTVTIARNQDRNNKISAFYQPTHRGKIQPLQPFKPHDVETIGEIEMLGYLKAMSDGNDKILVIDSRTPVWIKRSGTIPGATSIPFTRFSNDTEVVEIMEDNFDVEVGESWNFTYAKTLVMFCNGVWCGQSPTAIKKLLSFGYPAAKIKYYRGGMQSWTSLGLTVVK